MSRSSWPQLGRLLLPACTEVNPMSGAKGSVAVGPVFQQMVDVALKGGQRAGR